MAPWEVLLSVRLPFTGPTDFAKEFKQAPRRDDDIAIVNAGAQIVHRSSCLVNVHKFDCVQSFQACC
jgi:hypothetical protein